MCQISISFGFSLELEKDDKVAGFFVCLFAKEFRKHEVDY